MLSAIEVDFDIAHKHKFGRIPISSLDERYVIAMLLDMYYNIETIEYGIEGLNNSVTIRRAFGTWGEKRISGWRWEIKRDTMLAIDKFENLRKNNWFANLIYKYHNKVL